MVRPEIRANRLWTGGVTGRRVTWRRVAGAVAVLLSVVSAPSQAQGLLEHARGKAGEAWLLGSLHFGSDDLYPLGDAVEKAFAASDRLMVEVNLLELDVERVRELVTRHGTYRGDDVLRQHVPEQLWQRLVVASAGLGLPAEGLQHQRPWLAALSVTTAFLASHGLTPAQGVDQHFMRRARRAGLPIIELEQFSDQIGLLHASTPQEQVLMLEDSLAQVENGRSLPNELLAAWRVGDRARLQRLLLDGFAGSVHGRRFTRRLLDARNGPMATRIAGEVARGGTVFVVVGAAHLLGPSSVPAQLRRLGLDVTRR